MTYWYISFAGTDCFLGATVVAGGDAQAALANATLRGLNPGGQAAILEVLPEMESEPDMRAMVNRLLGREEMMAQGAKRRADIPEALRDKFDEWAEVVCEDCNPVQRD